MLIIVGCTNRGPTLYEPDQLPPTWRTHAELTDYHETGDYSQTIDFCRRLAHASPLVHYATFGSSGQGFDLPLLILSTDNAWSPRHAHNTGKPLVLIDNCIHPGECCGKDASLQLARDIALTPVGHELLTHVNLLIIPIFNVDGYRRFGPYNRINQAGPAQMGWRVTATNLNLNRDFAKADTPEMQSWLALWNRWQPDLFIDTHATDGSDHRYDLLYSATVGPSVPPPIDAWVADTLLPHVLPAVEAAGYPTFPYSGPVDRVDLTRGINAAVGYGPRYSHGYGGICNRPSILLEAHAYKPYRRRVLCTYEFIRATLELLNEQGTALQHAIRQADELTITNRGGLIDGQVPLAVERNGQGRSITYLGLRGERVQSDIAGYPVLTYTDEPTDVATVLFDQADVRTAIAPPAAYLIPPQWTDVIARLGFHGIKYFRLAGPRTLAVESCRFEEVSFPKFPFEGRHAPRYQVVPTTGEREFVAGTVVVPMHQRRARLVAHLLEPIGSDALLRWGFFNAIFERKEYFEAHAMEPVAREMLAADPELRQEFEQRLAADEEFANDANQRLNFFYERSSYYDVMHNRYPVGRLMDERVLMSLPAE